MRLRLNLDSVDTQLKVNRWKEHSEGADYDDEWCDVELYLHSSYLSYSPHGEILECGEVSWLKEELEAFLAGSVSEDKHISFIEPDWEFQLISAKRLYSESGGTWYRDGFVDCDIELNWIIHFWCDDGCLGSNQFIMTLDRDEILALYTYLRFVTKEIDGSSDEIQFQIKNDRILPE